MRTGKALGMLTVALVMASGAGLLAKGWISERLANASQREDGSVSIVAAALEIPFGHSIQFADVKLVRWPEDAAPGGAFGSIDEVIGRVATTTVLAGEILRKERVVEHGGGSALAAVIAPEKRAVTVRVNDVVGVGGFLLPGNRVDVIASHRGEDRKFRTQTLLEDLKVLAVDQTASPDKDEPVIVRAVTLEASRDEAEALVKATREGDVQLVLRNPKAPEIPKKVAKTEPAPQPKPKPKSKPAPPPQPDYVTVIKGTNVDRIRVAK